jgi:hypothetical protein
MRILQMSDQVRASFDPLLKALGPVRQELAAVKGVAAIRPGYFLPPTGKPLPAVVVALMPDAPRDAVDAEALAHKFGVPFTVIDATPEEQMAALQRGTGAPMAFALELPAVSAFERLLAPEQILMEFALPKTGNYQPLDESKLPLVEEPMQVTICVSPEAGWEELENFLNGTQERLTVAMYQFTAPHIFNAVRDSLAPGDRHLELVLHPRPEAPAKSGVKANDLPEEDIISQLGDTLGNRFKMSWATLVSKEHPDGLWASAYHIKVAVRDGKTFWLSSGNFQSSNQPAVHLFGTNPDPLPTGLQRKYNRDYHAIITNDKLASAYETYIKRDFDLTATAGTAQPFAMPDLFVPEEEPMEVVTFASPPRLFPPLRLERQVKVQPLLTPDNYAENALALIDSAQKSVWFQNQYINFRNNGEDFTEFQALVQALKKKIAAGLDIRIICRDLMKQENVDILLALEFPREAMRFQPACHNKTIIVDREKVVFGSHNWSNEGVKTNRDASLIFYDQEIADYLAKVYEYDWDRLATAKPSARQPRVASESEPTPPGFKRVPFSAIYED